MHKTLLLVDGSSYLYRAFHALPDMRSPAQAPTGALYGIISMLRKLRSDFPAAYLACVFDAKGKTFRDDMYPDYKATRASMPPDLALQIEPIHKAVRAMGWPILMVDGVEADDVIGTLAVQAVTHGMETVISTGDKDLAQLVNEHVMLINTMSNERLDPAGVVAKFGVPPERIVDYLTLIGDTVDNVPGVSKVGPKTAVKWLAQYGTLGNIIARSEEIGGAVGGNLRAALDWLPTAQTLITVRTDCDLSAHIASIPESLTSREADDDELLRIYTEAGFKSWTRELQASATPQAPGSAQPAAASAQPGLFDQPKTESRYELVLTETALDEWIARISAASLTAVDTETDGLDPMQAQLVGLSLSVESGHAAYIPLAHRYPDAPTQLDRAAVLDKMRAWFDNPAHAKVGQNIKFDRHILANHGVSLRGIVHDTMLLSYVIDSSRPHNMDSLALRYLNHQTVTFEKVCGKGAKQITFDQVALQTATDYAAEDADVTLRLQHTLWPLISDDPKARFIYQDIEIPVATVLQKIERQGVLIDAGLLTRQSAELGQRMMELEQRAYELAGQPFNLNSPKQIGEIFFDRLQLPVIKKTASGAPSTDEEVLQKLAEDYPLPKVLLEYRGLSKLKSTYTDKLPRMVHPQTGRVHTNYSQSTAVTGRLSSNEPNLQNIPIRTVEGRRIREAFIAAPGHSIVSADYSQIELRIMAHLSEDPAMLRAFAENEDIHRATAAEIFGAERADITSEQRRYAKVINFGLIYGMSAFGLAGNLGIERGAAQMYIERYFTRFAGVRQYMDRTREMARAQGYVETVFGRRLWLREINSPNGPRRAGAERAAINAPMQGTAADLIKLSMIAVQDWLETEKLASRMIMQVHDELVLEVPESELELVRIRLPELMAGVAQLKVPLLAEVGVGPNWEQAH